MSKAFNISLFLLFVIFSTTWGYAQDTKVEKLLQKVDPKAGITIDFTMTLDQEDTPVQGTYYAHGSAFYIESSMLKAWYDGTNLWVYVYQNGEINLSRPTAEEIADINPLVNIQNFRRRGFNINIADTDRGYRLTATPQKGTPYPLSQIRITASKDGTPLVLEMKDKTDGSTTLINIKSIKKGTSIDKKTFTFTPDKAPGVAVIDLR